VRLGCASVVSTAPSKKNAGGSARGALGALLPAVGVAIGTGLDRVIEAWVLDHSPDWLIAASTAF